MFLRIHPFCRRQALRHFFILLASLLLTACVSVPQRESASAPQAGWTPSPNFDARRANYVILHHTSNDNVTDALNTLTSPLKGVSIHYLVSRDGTILQLVDETRRAWHAGASWWGGQTDMNSASIGIELDNTGDEAYPDIQITALTALLADIAARHNIPRANFLAHADVAPARKSDPSALFPWERLAAAGFGIWCETPAPAPENFDPRLGLTALGYDPRQPEAALAAFRLHFVRAENATNRHEINAVEAALIHCLLKAKAENSVAPVDDIRALP
ncbi:MAG: N-acetylmuramoyl-L-alanine amidase [Zoogloeaceae bacterium]|nr:N-acetylmuramoyl-L-alanine amidase [Zoogloeaceae bacterium]